MFAIQIKNAKIEKIKLIKCELNRLKIVNILFKLLHGVLKDIYSV